MNDQPNTSRLDRVEAAVEKIAEETHKFQLAVGGAITAQQGQIEANVRAIAAVTKLSEENVRSMAELRRDWQAYLSTIHPKQ